MLKTVKLTHLVTLSSSPVACSCKNLSFSGGSWLFRLANSCSFFSRKKSCVTGGQTLRRPDSRSTSTAQRMRSHCRTQKKPTLQGKSRKLAYGQDRTLSRRKSLSSEHEHGCRSSAISLRSAQPFLFLSSSNLSSRFYLFIYLFIFEMSLEESKKIRRWTRVWFLCWFCKLCLVWIDFCHLANAQ